MNTFCYTFSNFPISQYLAHWSFVLFQWAKIMIISPSHPPSTSLIALFVIVMSVWKFWISFSSLQCSCMSSLPCKIIWKNETLFCLHFEFEKMPSNGEKSFEFLMSRQSTFLGAEFYWQRILYHERSTVCLVNTLSPSRKVILLVDWKALSLFLTLRINRIF